MREILCSISTRGRYETTLPLAIMSVINQTKKPTKLVIFDDNDNPRDVREIQVYQYIFMMLDKVGIEWEWVFADKKGQHFNHEKANQMGYKWVWRLDDDNVAEPDTLEKLYAVAISADNVGAVGGAILTPPHYPDTSTAVGTIDMVPYEPNIQWNYISETKQVDHLHCSFLYRAGVYGYDLRLSRAAHREETLFSYGLTSLGYKVFVTPAVTWHLRNQEGGIRPEAEQLFKQDDVIYQNVISTIKGRTVVVLDCGMGDHIVFKHVLPDIKNPLIFSCYPEIIPGLSIAMGQSILGNLEPYNVYRMMDRLNWKDSLESAFRKMYVR